MSGCFPQERIAICDSNSDCSDGSNNDDTMVVKVRFVQFSNATFITLFVYLCAKDFCFSENPNNIIFCVIW